MTCHLSLSSYNLLIFFKPTIVTKTITPILVMVSVTVTQQLQDQWQEIQIAKQIMKAYKVIIATTQKKLWLKRIAVKPNDFATFLMDQNSLPSLVVGAGIHPIHATRAEFNQICF